MKRQTMDSNKTTSIVDLINEGFDQTRTPMEVFGDVTARYPDVSVAEFCMVLATRMEELRLDIEEDKALLGAAASILFAPEKCSDA